jgi:DNA-binding transcriptional ArsR family regulator
LAEESFARELARILETPLFSIQQALRGLEAEGIVVGRSQGRTRLYRLNPRYFAREELERYLSRLAEPEEDLRRRISAIRRRPRRTGKPL